MRAAAASTAATVATLSLPRRDHICSLHPCGTLVVSSIHHLSCHMMGTSRPEPSGLHHTRPDSQLQYLG
jgi:hypothetical protein